MGFMPHFKPSKKGGVWNYARRAWALARSTGGLDNLSIPHWYAGYAGLPSWYLSQSVRSKKMTESHCKRAMIVRMNYILDTGTGMVCRYQYVRQSERMFPRFIGNHLLWDRGCYITCSSGIDFNHLFRLDFDDLDRVLACTAKAFVNLCLPFIRG